jgi:Erv1 / Alr family
MAGPQSAAQGRRLCQGARLRQAVHRAGQPASLLNHACRYGNRGCIPECVYIAAANSQYFAAAMGQLPRQFTCNKGLHMRPVAAVSHPCGARDRRHRRCPVDGSSQVRASAGCMACLLHVFFCWYLQMCTSSDNLCPNRCRGFMESFFPCDTCSKHFGSMAAEDDARLVQSPDDALLWSWRAHNRVRAQQGAC